MSEIIGWLGISFGLLVAPPQLLKIVRDGKIQGISLTTYIFLVLAVACYLAYAISIGNVIFITAQSISLSINSIILVFLVKYRKETRDGNKW